MDTAALIARIEAEIVELEQAGAATEGDRQAVELDQQSVGRLSRMDALQVQAMALEQQRRRGQRLAALKAALRRAAEDKLGWCQECGEAIAPARLELDPAAPLCIACASGR
ncbi:TraR/DksA C4-type zinc finger protein [Rhodobacteraceae bacterium NNCM2]|nr:TraR/DksA C4-type zinc finger protein [Coraliihabitans acroporae]